MNRAQFLQQLADKLSALPQSEISRALNFYEEIIDDRMEDGMSEEEAIASLEDIDLIAERVIVDNTPLPSLVRSRVREEKVQREQARKEKGQTKHSGWGWIILLLILGSPLWIPLLIVFGAVVLTIYVCIWTLIIALLAAFLGIAVAAIACVVAMFVLLPRSGLVALGFLGVGLLLAGLCILAWFPISRGVKALAQLTGRAGKSLGRRIKSLFIRKERK